MKKNESYTCKTYIAGEIMKDKDCPLCNGKKFKQGDDFKTLCIEHSTKVISLLLCGFVSDYSGFGKREKKCHSE